MKNLLFDESVNAFLTDDQGEPVLDPQKQPIPIRRDIVSGEVFKRVCVGIREADAKKMSVLSEALAKAGVVHYSSDKSELNGYWLPVDAKLPDELAARIYA